MTATRDEEERIIYEGIRRYFRHYEDKKAVNFLSFLYGQLNELVLRPNFVNDRVPLLTQ